MWKKKAKYDENVRLDAESAPTVCTTVSTSEEEHCNQSRESPSATYWDRGDGTHPLNHYLILTTIFRYLGVTDLKSCRLVSRSWKSVATLQMLSKGAISVDADDIENIQDLEGWMKSLQDTGPSCFNPSTSKFNKFKDYRPFKNFVFDKITHYSYPNIKVIMGLHVESVTVSHYWNDTRDLLLEDYEDLLVNQCPNLKELNIPTTPTFKQASKFLLYESQESKYLSLEHLILSGDVKPATGFWRIVKLSPNLKSLKLACDIPEEFWKPDPLQKIWNERMHNLKKLEVKTYANESVSNLSAISFMSRDWASLTSLAYESYVLTDTVMKGCSHHVAKTLEEYELVLFNKRYEPWPADKGKDWIIPPTMTKLKHFRLEIDDHCEGPIFCRTLVASVFLPGLITLRMGTYDDEDCNEEDWPVGLFERMLVETVGSYKQCMEIPVRTSIKVLKLPPKFQDTSCFQFLGYLYPNTVEVELEFPTPPVLAEVFEKWPNIERLKLTLCANDICWTTPLTGVVFLMEGMSEGSNVTFDPSIPALSRLQKLTYLNISLTSPPNYTGNHDVKFPLNDWFVYYGLMALPQLQSVFIKGHIFSAEAISSLRNQMLPFCSLNL